MTHTEITLEDTLRYNSKLWTSSIIGRL